MRYMLGVMMLSVLMLAGCTQQKSAPVNNLQGYWVNLSKPKTEHTLQAAPVSHTQTDMKSVPREQAAHIATAHEFKTTEHHAEKREHHAKKAQRHGRTMAHHYVKQHHEAIQRKPVVKTVHHQAVQPKPAVKTVRHQAVQATPVTPAAPVKHVAVVPHQVIAAHATGWLWPVKGTVVQGFTQKDKSITIAGGAFAPVAAAKSGKVIFAGFGVKRLGKMIIIQHAGGFLTAYGHNAKLLVKEGQQVKAGDTIAEMGPVKKSNRGEVIFEIRYGGQSVNPVLYLPTM
jgi:murein DD-endopeptidase MepM/ murein hydrolase activator NlpD